MSRFQLIFRDAHGERSEIHDNNLHGEPNLGGKPIVDGETYTIRGSEWVIRRDGRLDGMERFICIPASAP
jgi:hypothetical protein